MKHCEIVARQEVIIVLGKTETQAGVYITSTPLTKLFQPVRPEELGKAVLETLNSFKSGDDHPTPDELKRLDHEILRQAGFSSWRKLSKDAKRIGVKSDGNTVTATPTVAGPADGYADITELAVTSFAEPFSVGQAVLKALTKCRTTARF